MVKIVKIAFLLLLTSCSNLFFQGDRFKYAEPRDYKINYEEIKFHGKDGTELNAWYFPATTKEIKGTIIQFHGNAQNLTSHFYSLVWVRKQGYNLLTWDYRGYGLSDGESDLTKTIEDSQAALELAWKLHKNQGKFIVYGQSLGGAISMRSLVDFSHQDKVDLLVHDSSFNSYKDIAFDVLTRRWFFIPFSPLAYVLVTDKWAPEKIFGKIQTPTLVIVGENDSIVPPRYGKDTFKRLKIEKKWLWKIPNGNHINAYSLDEGRYQKDFLTLVDQLDTK